MSVATITAADVNKLRQMTGAGMMDCKKALVEAEGDFEKAVDFLRKKGQKVSAARAGNATSEGTVLVNLNADATSATLLAFACETEPVSKVEDFKNLAQAILDLAVSKDAKTAEEVSDLVFEDGRTVADAFTELTGKTGEKLAIVSFEKVVGEKIVSYIHSNGKLAVLVSLKNVGSAEVEAIGKDVAMQIAAMRPIAVDKDGVDASIVAREIEVGKEQARAEGKPEEMLEKIALGKLNKFYKDSTLLNQEFVKDTSKSVAQVLDSVNKGLTVAEFKRIAIGA